MYVYVCVWLCVCVGSRGVSGVGVGLGRGIWLRRERGVEGRLRGCFILLFRIGLGIVDGSVDSFLSV